MTFRTACRVFAAVLLVGAVPAAADVELFATLADLDDGDAIKLGVIDPGSGTVSVIGATGTGVGDIAFAPDGRLFGIDTGADRLVTIDSETGVATPVGPLGFDVDRESGLTFDHLGALWLVDRPLAGSRLYSVDPATGGATLRGEVGNDNCRALAALGQTIYGDGFEVLTIDTASGLGTAVADDHSGWPTVALSSDGAESLWSLRYCGVCMTPSDRYFVAVTSTGTWQSELTAALGMRWAPLGLAVRRVQPRQQAIPMLHPQLVGLFVVLLAIAGSVMLLRDGQEVCRQAAALDR